MHWTSSDVDKRIKQHNTRKVKSTKSRAPCWCIDNGEYSILQRHESEKGIFKTAAGTRWLDKNGF